MARKVKNRPELARANMRILRISAVVIVVMFGFGYVSAEFYDTICRALGVSVKTGRVDQAQAEKQAVDETRVVTVEFTGHAMAGLPWEFYPLQRRVEVHPGQITTIKYYARNPTRETVVGQAVPSVTPALSSTHFNKIECFCFTQQKLGPGESREMDVRFVVDRDLPAEVRTITLSYGFFNADPVQAKRFGAENAVSGS